MRELRRNLVYILGLIAVAAAIWLYVEKAPGQHNPFKELNLEDPIGVATYRKLTHAKHNPEACFAALDRAGILYTPREDQKTGANCGFQNALTLDRSTTPYSATLSMSCSVTAALYIWERHVMIPNAERYLGSPVDQIVTFGSYACRNVAGSSRRSEHAMANAIDVAAFKLANGRTIDVRSNWGKDTPEGKFLKKVHSGACRLFSVTLGPDYNAAHADHFHFDMGSGDLCR